MLSANERQGTLPIGDRARAGRHWRVDVRYGAGIGTGIWDWYWVGNGLQTDLIHCASGCDFTWYGSEYLSLVVTYFSQNHGQPCPTV